MGCPLEHMADLMETDNGCWCIADGHIRDSAKHSAPGYFQNPPVRNHKQKTALANHECCCNIGMSNSHSADACGQTLSAPSQGCPFAPMPEYNMHDLAWCSHAKHANPHNVSEQSFSYLLFPVANTSTSCVHMKSLYHKQYITVYFLP